ncbi:MAG: SDR family oxidoreductase [Candidatus Bathyarchaeota archaeon]|nr:SDR family oxidoreductase [Candidatus Bathyarchaeota archaeon]
MNLDNQVAIVTGGGRGIGKVASIALAKTGACIVVVSRTMAEIEAVANEIQMMGGEALAIQADVSKETEVQHLVNKTIEVYGHVDILVNNAAVNLKPKSLVDLTLEEWNWVMRINLTGVFLCTKYVLKHMIDQKSGKIVNVSSIGGRRGGKGRAPYRPSKAALINLTECVAAEAKEYNINVNTVCPGATVTNMIRDIFPDRDTRTMMTPEEVADVIVYLVSDAARALHGTSLDVTGRARV